MDVSSISGSSYYTQQSSGQGDYSYLLLVGQTSLLNVIATSGSGQTDSGSGSTSSTDSRGTAAQFFPPTFGD